MAETEDITTEILAVRDEVRSLKEFYVEKFDVLQTAVKELLNAIEIDGYGEHFDHVIKDSYTRVKELVK